MRALRLYVWSLSTLSEFRASGGIAGGRILCDHGENHMSPAEERHRLPFLDGIRAFAVCAVLLFHAGVSQVSGGLLGVDVFFVLSGFLITSLLCGEYLSSGSIRLGRFWAGRARRLLPGLFILLLGVAAYTWAFRTSLDVSSIRGDAISSLFYVANWHFIVTSQGYFSSSTTPSPLLHMWSLAVEEQYYLLWPGIVFVLLRRAGPRLVAWVSGVGAAASALLMATMYLTGFSTDRLYYGTDTRAQALLVGSLLGAMASKREWRVVPRVWASTRTGHAAGAVIGAIGVVVLLLSWNRLNGQNTFLYEGGFLVVALAAGGVITAVTSWRTSLLARLLSLATVDVHRTHLLRVIPLPLAYIPRDQPSAHRSLGCHSSHRTTRGLACSRRYLIPPD